MALHIKVSEKKAASTPVMYKNITFEYKDLNVQGRTVTGYLAVFGNIDSDMDRLVKGCFAKSLMERGVGTTGGNTIAHLWQHKMDMPLGTYTVLKEDDKGLYFECPYDDIQKANDALVQFKSGTLKNFSIGYSYIWDKMMWNTNDECFDIYELNLCEGSVVTLAANTLAMYTGMKAEQIVDEIQVLKEEAEEIFSTLKPRKRYELGQIFTKLMTLSQVKPQLESKDALKLEAERKEAERIAAEKKLADETAVSPKNVFLSLKKLHEDV